MGIQVLDFDEFVDIISTSKCLSAAFGDILDAANERRQREEYERLALIFRNPSAISSPNGRTRRRPALAHLRHVHEVAETMPWSDRGLPTDAAVSYSPPKAQLIRPPLADIH